MRHLVLLALAALALGPGAAAQAVAARPAGSVSADDSPSSLVLARTVAATPRAAPGSWTGWQERDVPASYRAALEAYRGDDLVATFGLALRCLDEAPDHPAALSLVGGVAFRLRRHEDAIDAFERFLVHAPEAVARTRHLAHAYHSVGRHGEARAHYERVLAAPDVTPEALRECRFGRALAAYRLGDHEAARGDLDFVLAAAPGDAEALTWLATLDFEAEDLAAARARAVEAEALAPFDPRPVFLRARVLAEQLAAAEAAPESERAVGADGATEPGANGADVAAQHLAALRAELAAAEARFAALAAYDARVRDLDATLVLAPDDTEARYALVRLALAAADRERALRHAAKLAAAAVGRSDAQLTVLEALERFGRPESAAAHAALLEATFAEDADVLEALAAFHARRGDVPARLRCGARAAELRAR